MVGNKNPWWATKLGFGGVQTLVCTAQTKVWTPVYISRERENNKGVPGPRW